MVLVMAALARLEFWPLFLIVQEMVVMICKTLGKQLGAEVNFNGKIANCPCLKATLLCQAPKCERETWGTRRQRSGDRDQESEIRKVHRLPHLRFKMWPPNFSSRNWGACQSKSQVGCAARVGEEHFYFAAAGRTASWR